MNLKNLKKVYETDASRLKGNALDVKNPKSIQEVKEIIKNSKRIVPRGGGSGFVGGSIPQGGLDIVLDLSKLNQLGKLEKERNTIEVGAGVILQDLQNYLEKYNLEFPVIPSSKEIATIGGMIATNATGDRSLKYGKTENWINWIEIINCYGELERKGVTEISDYSGMEGITGIIVKVCLKLTKKKKRTASIITVESFEEIISIVKNLKRNSNISMTKFLDKWFSKKLNLEDGYNLIIEYEDDSGNLKNDDYEKVLKLIDEIYPIIAREECSRIEDPKILIDKLPILVRWLEQKNIPSFGEISTGNLNPCFNNSQEELIPEMVKLVKRLGGQISRNYGVGILKKKFVEINDQKILRNIKKRTDPLNKFNQGKLI